MILSVMISRLNCHAVLLIVVPPCYSAGIRYFRLPYNDLAVQGDSSFSRVSAASLARVWVLVF
jgi:hypothetical protein